MGVTGIFSLNNLSVLLSGFGLGAALICFLWVIVANVGKRRVNKQKDVREKLMFAIGELIADADTMSASFRCGGLKWDVFSKGLRVKVNEITRELRTNMHLFDVFFVKYVEMQTYQYITVLENPERRGQKSEERSAPSDTGLRFTPVPDSAEAVEVTAPIPEAVRPDAVAVEKTEKNVEIEKIQQRDSKPIEIEDIVVDKKAKRAEIEELTEDFSPVEKTLPPIAPVVEHAPASISAPVTPVEHAPAPIASEPEPEQDTWSEKSDEEFEAGFAHFEETGYFQVTRVADEASEQVPPPAVTPVPPVVSADEEEEFIAAPQQVVPPAAVPAPPLVSAKDEEEEFFAAPPIPAPAAVPAAPIVSAADDEEEFLAAPPIVSADDAEEFIVNNNQYIVPNASDDEVMTETVCIDRIPIGALTAAPIAPAAPVAMPAASDDEVTTETICIDRAPIAAPPPAVSAAPVNSAAPIAAPAVSAAANEEEGITGDDVMDSIDNFFKLK